ncbi:MAG: TIGR01777 family oxidoreductase [Microbacterium sp.]|uniref:TIGR01777 family oxidoreductase n=1 Tax=Microbacterium sp. TaxID=51671 RepID=UPI002727C8EE|nr:TIGR01777 family oxidoreductase [Microbacterium sp.]MDO8381937.1 TIGR01777 family oxidoreductase [Microbacterium sp.]
MSQRVVIAGASGLIGRTLTDSLLADGVEVTTLVRREPQGPSEVRWLDGSPLDPSVLEGATAVVNLNGASIGRIPWTSSYKRTLVSSRLEATGVLAKALRTLGDNAPAFVSASAIGYYGSVPGRELREDAGPGGGFLSDLCVEWEATARTAGSARVALLRTAPVVHPESVLKPLILLTRFGLSGPMSRGTQVWPWISLVDEVRAIRHVIDAQLEGPVNLSGPTRATANDLGFALARRMNRPYILRAPAWALRLGLGRDMADAVLLVDAHVVPAALEASGFTFTHTTVDEAVAAVIPAAP